MKLPATIGDPCTEPLYGCAVHRYIDQLHATDGCVLVGSGNRDRLSHIVCVLSRMTDQFTRTRPSLLASGRSNCSPRNLSAARAASGCGVSVCLTIALVVDKLPAL